MLVASLPALTWQSPIATSLSTLFATGASIVSVLAEQNRNYCAKFIQNCRYSLWGADFDWVVFVARTTQSTFRMELLKLRPAR
ncbi:hypothetical protein C8R48DRAFT_686320 [Suillus tomentosus]|nr:hypothetical protein C8R48DRAFT_686320 [Suillus tomentosus]